MNNEEYLDKVIKIKMDRPFGSKHPKHGFMYEVNYGFVPNTMSGDGEELDCYILGEYKPLKEYKGECIAVIHRKEDDDDKLIIVPEGKNYTDEQINCLTEYQERFFKHIIIR